MSLQQKPIGEYLLPFLDYCEIQKGLSNNTQRNYRQYLKIFLDWLLKTGNGTLRPKDVTAAHVWGYRLHLARTYKTPAGGYLTKESQNFYLIALRALLNYFAELDIDSLPSSKINLAKQKSDHHVSFLELHEIEKLLALPPTSKPDGLRDRAIMETLFSSGMRINELVSLNVDMVSVLKSKKDPNKTIELAIIGKGKRVRTVFISARAASWIRAYLASRSDDEKGLFINNRSRNPEQKRLSPRYIQLMISKYARLAGLSKRVTPHTLRHTYATDLLARGADLRSVQELLGHKNVSTTQIYTHVTNKRLRDIHEKFHGGQSFRDS